MKIKYSKNIPKKIHQILIDMELSGDIDKNIKEIKSLNKDWIHTIYTDDDILKFIVKYYDDNILKLYKSINNNYGAVKADFFRYLCLYIEGGVYMDIKTCCKTPLNRLLKQNDSFVVSHWGEEYPGWGKHEDCDEEFCNFFICVEKQNPIIKSIIDVCCYNIQNYDINIHKTGKYGSLRLCGPIVFTKEIYKLKDKYSVRILKSLKQGKIVYNNLPTDHKKMTNVHYSKLNEPLIIL